MAKLDIESTEDTPRVLFNPEGNHFELSGRSLPEDAPSFYGPILDWLDDYYGGSPLPTTTFDIKLEYFNTASSKLVLDFLMKLRFRLQHQDLPTKGYRYHEKTKAQHCIKIISEIAVNSKDVNRFYILVD